MFVLCSVKATHMFMRCSWGYGMPDICPKSLCVGSNKNYGDFLFHEVITGKVSNLKVKTLTLLMNSSANCIYSIGDYTQVCSCRYKAFVKLCPQLSRVTFLGDSTSYRFKKKLDKVCNNVHMQSGGNKIVLVNEKTLHYLFLPFSREVDIPLYHSLVSISDYLNILNQTLIRAMSQHVEPSTKFIYMANNEVCPDLYTDSYYNSWRWLMDDINLTEIERIQHRRGTDLVSSLGFTLDYYGSVFASTLAKEFVIKYFPQIKYFSLAARYPGNCILSGKNDGRHFGENEYYIAKGRMLMHIAGV